MKMFRVALVAAFVAGLAIASQTAQAADEKKKKPAGTMGMVEKIDDGKSITIKVGGKKDPNAASRTYVLTKDTKYLLMDKDGTKDATAADLKSGGRVSVESESKDGADVAKTVTIMQGKK